MGRTFLLFAFSCCALFGCSGASKTSAVEVNFYKADQYPQQLSAWGLIGRTGTTLSVGADNHVYDLNTALFTDYALKLRTLYLPPGTTASYDDTNTFDLPTGSIIAKTFFYMLDDAAADHRAINLQAHWDGNPASLDMNQVRLIETRLLVKQADGWDALPYVWNGEDARLAITGDMFPVAVAGGDELNYLVPSRNECASCHAENHTTGDLLPIGIKARHLHRPDPVHGTNQLSAWAERGQLIGLPKLDQIPSNARWQDDSLPLDHRARSYLDINCGHCHNPAGAADTSGLLLNYADHEPGALGVCKAPIAAGRGSGGFMYSIVPGAAAESILTFRMSTTNPATMMPELGRTLVHREGLELVSQWIDSLQGECL